MYATELKSMQEAARGAGRIIMEIYDSVDFNVRIKSDSSPVTEADHKADEFIINHLRELFADYAFLTEESADTPERLDSDFCFIIDPLDGTKEFIKRNGEFTVNIALCTAGRIVAGVILLPATGDLYYAAEGAGAFLEKDGLTTPLHVSGRTTNPRLAVSRSHRTPEEDRLIAELGITEVIEAGSSLKGCLVARGDAEMYYRYGNTMEWDVGAMQIIVEEAGGVMRHIDGTAIRYNKPEPKNPSFYARAYP
jgi:3'(2'), 5'-bisphosphate nucleotidase